VDAAGNLYIADTGNSRIRKVSNGIITTVAGNGGYGFSGDNGRPPAPNCTIPTGRRGFRRQLYIADTLNGRVRKVSNGVITTIAGNGTYGFSGDNGPATSAQLSRPYGVAVDSAGNVYVADRENNRIRVLTPAAVTTQKPTIISMVNAASYIGGPISPGELVTIFGSGVGPAAAAYADTDPSTGKLATTIGGVQVLFSGVAAPMIYASSTQVSAVVPYEMASFANPSVSISYAGETSNADQVTLAVTAPGLFAQNSSASGPGAILNQDNSLNGPAHPAAKGSVRASVHDGRRPDQPARSHGRDYHRDPAASAGDAGAATTDPGMDRRPTGPLEVRRGSAGHGSGGDAAQRADPNQRAAGRALDSGVGRRKHEPERPHRGSAVTLAPGPPAPGPRPPFDTPFSLLLA